MANLVPIITDPVEVAVQTLVNGSHLSNVRDFIPILKIGEIKEGDKLPVVTAETIDYWVQPDMTNASVGFMISIWDYYPQRDSCTTEEQVRMLAVEVVKAYAEDLVEITDTLVGSKGDQLFPDADYTIEEVLKIRPRYKKGVFSSAVEAKNSDLSERLMGATITGRLHGNIKWICCTKKNFDVE